MSTFEGPVMELPGVSVDRFDKENLSSSVYFLTHYHTDHTQGLNKDFFEHLKEERKYLYCTKITKLFLKSRCCLNDQLMWTVKELTPCSPTIVEYSHNGNFYSIVVSCVPAGHCPGSVMYIFKTNNVRILYTGDFRIAPEDFPKLKALNDYHEGKVTPLKFDKIYLDTTFLNPEYSYFPTRKESLDEICSHAINWLGRNPTNDVYIQCPAYYGSEFIIIELWERLGERVHITEGRFRDYSHIGELSMAVTDNPCNTRIHACSVNNATREKSLCSPVPGRSLIIATSALFWDNLSPSDKISMTNESNPNYVRVCISMHPSYSEIKAFLEYFDFPDVYACVNPPKGVKVLVEDLLIELRSEKDKKESAPLPVEESVDFDLRSLIGSPAKRRKSSFFSDENSD